MVFPALHPAHLLQYAMVVPSTTPSPFRGAWPCLESPSRLCGSLHDARVSHVSPQSPIHTFWRPGIVLFAAEVKACASQFAHFAQVVSCQGAAENGTAHNSKQVYFAGLGEGEPVLPSLATPGQSIRLPGQTKVTTDEYKEFLGLGHGDIYDLDPDL